MATPGATWLRRTPLPTVCLPHFACAQVCRGCKSQDLAKLERFLLLWYMGNLVVCNGGVSLRRSQTAGWHGSRTKSFHPGLCQPAVRRCYSPGRATYFSASLAAAAA